jgi:alpha-ketoglutarate-dependent taurine dioxygenase
MSDIVEKPSLAGLASLRRKQVHLSQSELVETGFLVPGSSLPLVIRPAEAVEGLSLITWGEGARDLVRDRLRASSAVLFRGFDVGGVEGFESFLRAIVGELLDYSYRSTPRSLVRSRIYTSTEYPSDQQIPFHNEMSYSRQWPLRIAFFCQVAATHGGATPIADSRKVLERIPQAVRERFAAKGVLYVRNYGKHLDLPWEEVFQTSDRSEVERLCESMQLDWEWIGEGRLRTRQVCRALTVHPETGEAVWFNQAHLFHVSSLGETVQEALLQSASEEDLPRNTYYGDGAPIEPEVLALIREAYQHEAVSFTWQPGDVLLLDNMLIAHGREPFQGPRKVVVGMAEAITSTWP